MLYGAAVDSLSNLTPLDMIMIIVFFFSLYFSLMIERYCGVI